jgi:tryptophan synthase alpha chain
MSSRVEGLATKVRRFTDLPIAIGFGISTPEHVAEVAKFSDGAVIGSQVINTLADGEPSAAADRVGAYIKSLASGTPRKVVAN